MEKIVYVYELQKFIKELDSNIVVSDNTRKSYVGDISDPIRMKGMEIELGRIYVYFTEYADSFYAINIRKGIHLKHSFSPTLDYKLKYNIIDEYFIGEKEKIEKLYNDLKEALMELLLGE